MTLSDIINGRNVLCAAVPLIGLTFTGVMIANNPETPVMEKYSELYWSVVPSNASFNLTVDERNAIIIIRRNLRESPEYALEEKLLGESYANILMMGSYTFLASIACAFFYKSKNKQ